MTSVSIPVVGNNRASSFYVPEKYSIMCARVRAHMRARARADTHTHTRISSFTDGQIDWVYILV